MIALGLWVIGAVFVVFAVLVVYAVVVSVIGATAVGCIHLFNHLAALFPEPTIPEFYRQKGE